MAILEVCVDSIESAIAAQQGGAARIELCSALSEGGLTPSPGFLRALKQDLNIKIPIFCMLRPRRGNDFQYSVAEMKQIIYDLEILKELGSDGFVFGALDEKFEINIDQCKEVISASCNLPVTFHRAFDLTKPEDIMKNCELIQSLGFRRLLTSGLKPSALAGLEMLKKISEENHGDLVIIPGAGINSCNLEVILNETNFKEFHASARKKKLSLENEEIAMGKADSEPVYVTDRDLVKELVYIGSSVEMQIKDI